jgi:hypothetical protein
LARLRFLSIFKPLNFKRKPFRASVFHLYQTQLKKFTKIFENISNSGLGAKIPMERELQDCFVKVISFKSL